MKKEIKKYKDLKPNQSFIVLNQGSNTKIYTKLAEDEQVDLCGWTEKNVCQEDDLVIVLSDNENLYYVVEYDDWEGLFVKEIYQCESYKELSEIIEKETERIDKEYFIPEYKDYGHPNDYDININAFIIPDFFVDIYFNIYQKERGFKRERNNNVLEKKQLGKEELQMKITCKKDHQIKILEDECCIFEDDFKCAKDITCYECKLKNIKWDILFN